MGLIEQIKGKKVYLDTNIFIYIFENYSEYEYLAKQFMDTIGNGDIQCYTGEISLAELLVNAFKESKMEIVEQYTTILNDPDFIQLIPTNQEIYIKSAYFRAKAKVKLPDAIHFASADFSGCDIFLTNDTGIKSFENMEVLQWNDYL